MRLVVDVPAQSGIGGGPVKNLALAELYMDITENGVRKLPVRGFVG